MDADCSYKSNELLRDVLKNPGETVILCYSLKFQIDRHLEIYWLIFV